MEAGRTPSVTVVNFNAPELHHLAGALVNEGVLYANCRPYANKGRTWERFLEGLPYLGRSYRTTFGRRKMTDPRLVRATVEIGIVADWVAAAIARVGVLPTPVREFSIDYLHECMRRDISMRGGQHAVGATHVVAYPGCALPAFHSTSQAGGKSLLSYPIAHHRFHKKMCEEEAERQPEYAASWRVFEKRREEYFAVLDEECAVADRIVVGSGFVRDSFVAEGFDAEKIEIIPYGVDTQVFPTAHVKERSGAFNVLFVGQISQRKGVSYLLDAYRRFRRPDTRLTLVGRFVGPEETWRQHSDLYTHIANLPRHLLANVYGNSDVFVFPSLLEGLPLVVLEAMASGLPVIVTPNGCADIVRDGVDGFVVPVRDPEALQEKLELLYSNPELGRTMGENARARALGYTWSRYNEAMIDFIGAGSLNKFAPEVGKKLWRQA